MITLENIRANCQIEDADSGTPHLIWRTYMTGKTPRIWAPDYTQTRIAFTAAIVKAKGNDAAIVAAIVAAMKPMITSQAVRRAAYHLSTGKPLPSGWRVFATCNEPGCIEHYKAGTTTSTGAQITRLGWHKDSIRRKLANRAISRNRSKVDMNMIREIRDSTETGVAISGRLGLSASTISRVRLHVLPSHESPGNPFSGLGGRA